VGVYGIWGMAASGRSIAGDIPKSTEYFDTPGTFSVFEIHGKSRTWPVKAFNQPLKSAK
jgi:hypothetical protein